jgi:PDDEXK-like domain of unknown function (DUF3799)
MSLIYGMSSTDYHSHPNTFSSSQLKDLIEDPEYFYRKYIKKDIERLELPAFDVGSYFHTAILEPEKLTLDCAVFEGIRRGEKWEKFKEDNKGKAIITSNEKAQADGLIEAVRNSPVAMRRITKGQAEVSAFIDLLIVGNDIYCPDPAGLLGRFGFESVSKVPKKGTKVTIKVRADLLAEDFILDLKSTTGNAKSEYDMRSKISNYHYDLSAALYLDMFSLATEKRIDDFIWTFASKDMFNCKNYLASPEMIMVGRAKYRKALLNLAEGLESEWQFEDSMGILKPNPYELEWIKPSDAELL